MVSSHCAARTRRTFILGRFDSDQIAPHAQVPIQDICLDAATQRHVMNEKATVLVWTAPREPCQGHADRDERLTAFVDLQLWILWW